jgi:Protein-tyrosine phosphatase
VSVVVVCPECKVYWDRDGQAAKCEDASHVHHNVEVHRHRTAVVLPDGSTVTAVSFDPGDPYGREQRPDYGLYLDSRWQPPWPHDHIGWPDFGVPADETAITTALRSLLARARAGQRVEVGCLGGHGRTGTALACLAVLTGCPPAEAVAWVREHYCPSAVETPEQEAFVTRSALI